jgi:hypothetical protein
MREGYTSVEGEGNEERKNEIESKGEQASADIPIDSLHDK